MKTEIHEINGAQVRMLNGAQVRMLPTDKVYELGRHPYTRFLPPDDKAVRVIAHDMREHGYDPEFPVVLALRVSKEDPQDVAWAVLDGWLRVLAAREAGIPEIAFVQYESMKKN